MITRVTTFPIAAIAIATLGLSAPPASAQGAREFRALSDQLARIERDLRDLERQVYARQAGPQARPDAFIDPDADLSRLDGVDDRFLDRLGGLEQEVRGLTAKVEESLFRVDQLERRMNAMEEDLAFSLAERGGPRTDVAGGAQDAMAASSPTAGSDVRRSTEDADVVGVSDERAPVTTPSRTRGEASATPGSSSPSSTAAGGGGARFDAAKDMLLRGDLEGAQTAFTAFLADEPDHPQAPEARYWLGEALFASGDYDGAAQAFLQAVRADADGGRAPESYLKLGMALGALGETAEACEVFDDLPRRFSDASSGLLRRMQVARDEVGCA